MTTHVTANRFALPPPATAVLRRAKIILTAFAVVAAMLLVAVGSWPLKALIVLVFVRGFFASDVMAMRNAPRAASPARADPPRSMVRQAVRPGGWTHSPHGAAAA